MSNIHSNEWKVRIQEKSYSFKLRIMVWHCQIVGFDVTHDIDNRQLPNGCLYCKEKLPLWVENRLRAEIILNKYNL